MLAVFLLACDFAAATKVVGIDSGAPDSGAGDADADTDSDADSDADADADGDADADADSGNPFERDDDGDGVTENDGDCDDTDPDRHPGASDACNGIDDDCDDELDEDASTGDAYEPNDTAAADLGSLDDDPDMAVTAVLINDDDVDRFSFSLVDDTFDFFTVTATLSNIPTDANYRFTLNRLSSAGGLSTGEMDEVFGSGTLTLSFGDTSFQDDGGEYELVVESIGGADCSRSYLLGIKQ